MAEELPVWLKLGSAAWNAWRREHPEIAIMLDGANLNGMILTGMNFSGASLRGASLHAANLMNADLREADFTRANLCEADLIGARLKKQSSRVQTYTRLACAEQPSRMHNIRRQT